MFCNISKYSYDMENYIIVSKPNNKCKGKIIQESPKNS